MAVNSVPTKIETDLLEKEYFHLQNVVQDYDAKALTIKAWSVSIVGVIAGSSVFTSSKEVLLFASVVSFMFWLIEGTWKSFQRSNYDRINEIEAYMRGAGRKTEIHNLQISKSWVIAYEQKYNKLAFMRKTLLRIYVFLPHGAFGLLLLIAYFVLKIG